MGGAAAQMGKWRGARVLGVDRHPLPSESAAAHAVDEFFDLEGEMLGQIISDATGEAVLTSLPDDEVLEEVPGAAYLAIPEDIDAACPRRTRTGAVADPNAQYHDGGARVFEHRRLICEPPRSKSQG